MSDMIPVSTSMRFPHTLVECLLALVVTTGPCGCAAIQGSAKNDLVTSPTSVRTQRQRMERFLALLRSDDREGAREFYVADARMWFEEKRGDGETVGESRWREWDEEMHTKHRVEDGRVDGNTVVVVLHEVNDFARLLDFPGWRARMTYWFNACGEVVEILYAPMAVTPTLAECMEPVVIWLKANRPAQLTMTYAGEQIVPSRANTKAWRMMLEDWRSATGRGEVECSAK